MHVTWKTMRGRAFRSWLPVVLGILLGTSQAVAAVGPAQPSDFSPKAVVLGFDELSNGQTLANQYRIKGVLLSGGDGKPLWVVDAVRLGGTPPSTPNMATAIGTNAVALRFPDGIQRLGLKLVATLTPNDIVYLRVYDAGGKELYTLTYQTDGNTQLPPGELPAHFLGVAADAPVIRYALLETPAGRTNVSLDDLQFEPQPDTGAADTLRNTLTSPGITPEAQIEAMGRALLQPSEALATVFRDAARDATLDPGVRQRAVLSLQQLQDPAAMDVVVEVAETAKDPYLRMAAYQAAWSLRKAYPLANPPQVDLAYPATGVSADKPFDLAVTVTSPVARDYVQVRIVPGKGLRLSGTAANPVAFKGPMAAGETVTLNALVEAVPLWMASPKDPAGVEEPRPQSRLDVLVRVNQGPVDISTYRFPLYVDFSTGTVSEMPPTTDEPQTHVIETAVNLK